MKIKIKMKTFLIILLVFSIASIFMVQKGNITLSKVLSNFDSPYSIFFLERHMNQRIGGPSLDERIKYSNSLIDGFESSHIYYNISGFRSNNKIDNINKAKKTLIIGLENEKNLENNEKK